LFSLSPEQVWFGFNESCIFGFFIKTMNRTFFYVVMIKVVFKKVR
jgi:hypothetical protein